MRTRERLKILEDQLKTYLEDRTTLEKIRGEVYGGLCSDGLLKDFRRFKDWTDYSIIREGKFRAQLNQEFSMLLDYLGLEIKSDPAKTYIAKKEKK